MSAFTQGQAIDDDVVIPQILQSEGASIAPQNPLTTSRIAVVANISGYTWSLQLEQIAETIDPFQLEHATGCIRAKKLTSAGNFFCCTDSYSNRLDHQVTATPKQSTPA